MIGRKLVLLQNGQTTYEDGAETFLKAQYLEELKHSIIKTIKRQSYNGLVAVIRLYFRGTNLLKNKYQELKVKIKNIHSKKLNDAEKKEVSKFLKMISEYKQKIRAIKHRIKEEEEIM